MLIILLNYHFNMIKSLLSKLLRSEISHLVKLRDGKISNFLFLVVNQIKQFFIKKLITKILVISKYLKVGIKIKCESFSHFPIEIFGKSARSREYFWLKFMKLNTCSYFTHYVYSSTSGGNWLRNVCEYWDHVQRLILGLILDVDSLE